MTVRRLLTGVAAAGVVLLTTAAPALAAPTSTIEQVEVEVRA